MDYNSILFLCSPRPLKKTGVVSFLLLNGSLSLDLLAMSCLLHSIVFIECLFWARLWSMPWESLGNKTARSLLRGLLVAGLGIFCLSARPVFPTLHLPTALEAWPHHRLPSTLDSTKATYLCLSYNLSCPKHVLLFLSILYTELFLYILVKTLTLSNPNSWLKKKKKKDNPPTLEVKNFTCNKVNKFNCCTRCRVQDRGQSCEDNAWRTWPLQACCPLASDRTQPMAQEWRCEGEGWVSEVGQWIPLAASLYPHSSFEISLL